MKHSNLRALMKAQNSHNNKLYHIGQDTENPDTLVIEFWSGARIQSYPNSHWDLTINPNNLTVMAMEAINLFTPPEFTLKKHAPRKFSIGGEDWLGNGTIIHFDAVNKHTYINGVLCKKDLLAGTKELHKLTRRIRKKVQPQLRLLGTGHFQKKNSDIEIHRGDSTKNEITYLMKVLDGKEVIDGLDKLRVLCDMDNLFGNGRRWSRNDVSDFQPKKIIDKVLRRVGVHKIAILEKYDERTRT